MRLIAFLLLWSSPGYTQTTQEDFAALDEECVQNVISIAADQYKPTMKSMEQQIKYDSNIERMRRSIEPVAQRLCRLVNNAAQNALTVKIE